MTAADRQRADQALDWARRVEDPEFRDWDAHLAWLEADPRHAEAFDEACLLIEAASRGLAPAMPLQVFEANNDNPVDWQEARPAPARRRWYAGIGIAAAAAVAGIVTIPSLLSGGPEPYMVQTQAGEHREIALADGTRIALNGGSAVQLDRRDGRLATLVRGEAYFTVVHDAAHPFAVRAGDALFQDVGTAFDVVRDDGRTAIAVREGAVMYDPKGSAVRLDGGQAMAITATGATVRQIDGASAGAWRQGRLAYRDAALGEVAADLARTIGRPVRVDRALAGRRFSGVIMIDADRARMFQRIAAIMDVAVRPEGAGWRMVPIGR